MSVGDIVVVKEEGHSNSHKTQLILHLQSISQGTHENIGEAGTTVLAVETQDMSEGEEIEYGYPITCGDSKAVLLFKKFVCPGINAKCVKFNDQLISPKQFVHLAGKATLKDWKRAIRLGGVMLRKMMDSGQIDFYQHETVCTNSCRSTKFDLLINSTRVLPSVLQTPVSSPPVMEQVYSAEDRPEETVSHVGNSYAPQVTPTHNGKVRIDTENIYDETLSLWKSIAEMGLMGDVVSTIRSELLSMLRGVERRSEQANLQEADAAVLTTLTQMFGLLDSVRQVLDLQRSKTEDNQHQIHTTLSVLADQLDKHKQKTMFHESKPTSFKRSRLQRDCPNSAMTSSSSSFTVLSPLTLPSSSQSPTIAGLPVDMLTLLPTSTVGRAEAMIVGPPTGITMLSTNFGDKSPAVEVLRLRPGPSQEGEAEEVVQEKKSESERKEKTEQKKRKKVMSQKLVDSNKPRKNKESESGILDAPSNEIKKNAGWKL
ncbi:glucocorticoid modulatory element-binding protein 1-like isoform X2 [Hoplias malabaricus]|uniref:glucocorticoid modulatory element-binding protein 1-like isoform X2 n=1 Tax=Hoplias malabaricus TaxID=27720 RepID=UPI003462C97C